MNKSNKLILKYYAGSTCGIISPAIKPNLKHKFFKDLLHRIYLWNRYNDHEFIVDKEDPNWNIIFLKSSIKAVYKPNELKSLLIKYPELLEFII